MIFAHQSYRAFLKEALAEKAKEGRGYSLRAFSEKLGVSNSYLSEVLNSRKSLSVDLALKIALRLGLTDLETQYICLMVQLELEKDPDYREELQRRLQQINPCRPGHDLTADVFKTISEWYHLAILELTFLPGFRLNPEQVAQKLGIQKLEAELAIERLLRLELIEPVGRGIYKKAHSYVLTESKIPNSAFRQYHRQILELAIKSLEKQSPKERMSATDMIAIDSKHLPTVNRLSQEFSNAVLKLGSRSKVPDSVYALSVHFFRLNEFERKKP